MEAETGVTRLEAKAHPGLMATTRTGEATNLLPTVSQGVRPCRHLMSDFWSPERREYSSVHRAILSGVLCACSPRRRMQRLPLLSFFDLLNHLTEPTVLSFLRSPLPLLCPSAWFPWAFWPPPTT